MTSQLPAVCDVLVVGAGPVGMTLALALRRAGVSALVVDRHAAGLNTSRAAVIHARTLEVLEPLGVVPQLLARGIRAQDFRIREGEKVLMQVGFAGLPSAYPFALLCPQNDTEAILLKRLHADGGEVVRPARLQSLQQADDGVAAALEMPDGSVRTVRAGWVVGCDGGHSTVRTSAGIGFDGGDYADRFVLADVRMHWPLPREEVSLFLSPEGLMVVAALPDDRWRIVATCRPVAADAAGRDGPQVADAAPSLADIQALLTARGPRSSPGRIDTVLWSSGFHLQHRVASQVFQGRVLLCGDAAHVHSPAGGQGMNTGIQDAAALAGPLADALRGAGTAAIADWAKRRQEVAAEVVRMTDTLTRMATAASPFARSVRNAALGLLGHVPFVEHRIARRLAELDN